MMLHFKILIYQQTNEKKLTIFHVNDIHGWVEPHDGFGGMAHLLTQMETWGYNKDDSATMLFSGGDDSTGPAVATLSKGMAMIDIMNEMGFSAAAVGNHEFDFGEEWLINRNVAANFPMLSANIHKKGTQDSVDYATPWVVQDHGGVKVGIIGLTVSLDFLDVYADFGDYETAILSNIDAVRTAGADVVIVLAHLGAARLKTIANAVSDLDVALFLGGHDSSTKVTQVGNSYVVEAGHYNEKMAKIELLVDIEANSFSFIKAPQIIDNLEADVVPNQDVQNIIESWKAKYNIDEVITKTTIDIGEPGSGNLVSDSFLHYFRVDRNVSYNFGALSSGSSFRDYYRAGDITIGDIISVNPFDNFLLNATITGRQLITVISTGADVSGVNKIGSSNNYEILVGNEYLPIDLNANYTGVLSNFLYDNLFSTQFKASETGIHYRDPIVCYYRTIDDLANFDDEKYIPEDHGNKACTQTIQII